VGYNVFRGTANGGPYQTITTMDAETTYTDYTVDSGTTYYYVVTQVDAQGQQSAYSNVAKAVIPGS
jgi:fibronectin type 3 domain-containing protein